MGDDIWLMNYSSKLCVFIGIGDPLTRKELSEKYKCNKLLEFPNIIDPSVILDEKICLGIGNIICANSVLTVDITLGNLNHINLCILLDMVLK